jgi:hypothetical protein
MTLITNWINAKFEYICGAICGLSVINFDLPTLLLKIAMAVILGGAGAFGGWAVKSIIAKISQLIKKKYGKV